MDPTTYGGELAATGARPEPVLDEARVAGNVTSALTGLLMVGVVAGLVEADAVDGLVAAGVAIAGGVVTVVNYVVPRWRARKARPKVTPLEDPRDNRGRPLTPDYTPG